MATGTLYYTDLFQLNNVVQNTLLTFPKEVAIDLLRDEFNKDSYFHFVRDEWGFVKTPSLLGVPSEAGLHDDETTRIFIAEKWRFNTIFYPAVLVSMGNMDSTPLSFNRDRGTVQWEAVRVYDGYGNFKNIFTPKAFLFNGAWQGSINVDVWTRGIRARDEIVEFISLAFVDILEKRLWKAGVFIRGLKISAPSEGDDLNEKLYKQTITVDIRTEWARAIPVQSVCDAIALCVEFGVLDPPPPRIAPNLTIRTDVNLLDKLESL